MATMAAPADRKRGNGHKGYLSSIFLTGLSALLVGWGLGVGFSLPMMQLDGSKANRYYNLHPLIAGNAQQNANSSSGAKTTLNQQSRQPLVLPLPHCVKYSHRPVEHLKLHNVTIEPWMLPVVKMSFLKKSTLSRHDGLYAFETYLQGFEGSVTFTWIAILNRLASRHNDHIVLDAGMNTGFYTTLTAVMGFSVHAFDIQLDCFDVASLLLKGNGVESNCNFYHLGLWSNRSTMTVQEGCDPGRGVDNYQERTIGTDVWDHRTHNVTVLPLDTFLDSVDDNKRIAILKMDIEGSEIYALQGLSTHYHSLVQNIIMECALQRIRRVGLTMEQTIYEFERLERSGFTAYLLHQPRIPRKDWRNEDHLVETWGVHALPSFHPVLGASMVNQTIDNLSSNVILWKVADWNILLTKGACGLACNLFFTKMSANRHLPPR